MTRDYQGGAISCPLRVGKLHAHAELQVGPAQVSFSDFFSFILDWNKFLKTLIFLKKVGNFLE
jgi:hypothetical protein